MKRLGANAWRTAHNPPTPALLDAADALGMLVVLEHQRLGAGDEELADLRALLLRDRHHPSVIAWSLCNEGFCRAKDDANWDLLGSASAKAAEAMQRLVRSLDGDGGRVVTAALHKGFGGPLEESFATLVGYNYHANQYAQHALRVSGARKSSHAHVGQILFASEVSSAFSDRDEYAMERGGVRGVDNSSRGNAAGSADPSLGTAGQPQGYLPATGEYAPGWGSTWTHGWCAVYSAVTEHLLAGGICSRRVEHPPSLATHRSTDKTRFSMLAPGFAWSGFDYRGEPFGWEPSAAPSTSIAAVEKTSGAWPFVLSRFGLLDYAGFEKEGAHFFRAFGIRMAASAAAALQQPSNPRDMQQPASAAQQAHHHAAASKASHTAPSTRHTVHTVHLAPSHWNWPSGSTIDVQAYSSADYVEIKLNGRSLGRQAVGPCIPTPRWKVPFESGTLRATAFVAAATATAPAKVGDETADGAILSAVAFTSVSTAGVASALAAFIDYPTDGSADLTRKNADGADAWLRADNDDVALITVRVIDASGLRVPDAATNVSVILHGHGRLLSLANGDPASHQMDRPTTATSGFRSTWHGLLRVVVQAGGHPSLLTLTFKSATTDEGAAALSPTNISLRIIAPRPRKHDLPRERVGTRKDG